MKNSEKTMLRRLVMEQIEAGNDIDKATDNITRIFDFKRATVRNYYRALVA